VFSYPLRDDIVCRHPPKYISSVINKFGRTELIPLAKQYVGIEAAANAPVGGAPDVRRADRI
jgi:hypothetical protein